MMDVLLGQLAVETFRVDLTSWVLTSYILIGFGILIILAGMILRRGKTVIITYVQASRFYSRLAIFNGVMAGIFVIPVLDPAFEFPILITRWPGIYMVIAYFSFLIISVLGNAAWSSLLSNSAEEGAAQGLRKGSLMLQLVFTQIGSYGLAAFMFFGGYVGASVDYSGFGPTIVGSQMEFAVVPSAVSIFLIVTGEWVGAANLVINATHPSKTSNA
jgi:hypothetical protein